VNVDCERFLRAALRGDALDAGALAHRARCADCAALPASLPDLARALASRPVVEPPSDLSARVLAAATPALLENARAAREQRVAAAPRLDGRRLARALLPAVLLFPLVVLVDVLLLRALHDALASLLPQGITTYLVASYAALLAALVCLTFGAIPLLVQRQEALLVQRQGAASWKEGHV
jgi:hypothetical protein